MSQAGHAGQEHRAVVHRTLDRTAGVLAVLLGDTQAGHCGEGSLRAAVVAEDSQARPC
jgi:hypothetical protein